MIIGPFHYIIIYPHEHVEYLQTKTARPGRQGYRGRPRINVEAAAGEVRAKVQDALAANQTIIGAVLGVLASGPSRAVACRDVLGGDCHAGRAGEHN